MCFLYDDDGYRIGDYTDRVITARKRHKCVDCGQAIEPGQQYHHLAFMWASGKDRDFVSDRWCLACQGLRRQIANIEADRGCYGYEAWPPAGELWDALRSRDYEVNGWFGFYRRRRQHATA